MTPTAAGPARRSATALSTPPLIATAVRAGSAPRREDRADRVRERIRSQPLAGHRRCLEQRQADERSLEPVRVRLDDPVSVDDEPHAGPIVPARRISGHLEHGVQASEGLGRAPCPGEKKCPTLPMSSRRVANLDEPGGCPAGYARRLAGLKLPLQ